MWIYVHGSKFVIQLEWLHIFTRADKHSSIFTEGYTMSGRKRKSLWDSKEETEIPTEFGKHDARHGREIHYSHHAKWSELEGNNALNSNNDSRRSSSEIWQDNNGRRDYNEIPKTERAVDGAKSYNRSPGFNGRGKQNHSPQSEIYLSQSHRYQRSRSSSWSKGRAGSRSRSRGKDRGKDREMDKDTDGIRSRGRDRDMDNGTHGIRSRGRDREMDRDSYDIRSRGRDRDMDNVRSRGRDRDIDRDMDSVRSWSRGRDRDMDKGRDTNRSRSSLSDHRREHNEMGDRRSGAKASSQLCRDFSGGMCRRGDQCRFLHEETLNLRNEGRPERDRAERLRGREESSEAFSADDERLRYQTLDKVSNYDRSNRISLDHDHRRQPHKNGNIPCKYFAMGRCHRDDCRFSHDQPGGVKERVQYDRYAHHPADDNKYRNGPKWSDANCVSDMNINDWNDHDTGKMNYTDRTTARKQAYGRMDQDVKDKNISWNGPKWSDVSGVSDVTRPNQWVDSNAGSVSFPEPPIAGIKTDERCGNSMEHMMWNKTQNGSNTANVDTFESTHAATFDREVWIDSRGSHLQTVDGTSLQTCEKVIEGASNQQHINNVGHPLGSETSYVQQHDTKRGNDDMSNDNSIALKGVSVSGNAKQLLLPEQSFNQNNGSSVSMPFNFHKNDQRNVILVSPSKGHETDPNRSDKQLLYLNRQDESKNLFEELNHKQQVFESELPQVDLGLPQNDMTSYQVRATTNLSASLNEIFSNGKQLPELYAVLNPKNSTDLLTSLSCSASVNSPVVASTVGRTTMFPGQHVPIGNTIEPGKHEKSDKPYEQENHGSDNTLYEEKKPTTFEHLLHSSTDRISEDANNNKPYELGEPKPLDQILLSSIDGPDSGKIEKICSPVKTGQISPTVKLLKPDINLEAHHNLSLKSEKCKPEEDIPSDNANPEDRVREGNNGKDEKEMRLFKVALVDCVKEILKPAWKEGQMSREVHKSIVKKVVDKVTGTIQGVHVPKTQEKVDQYLACSKPKLTKLVQAYTERLLKS